MPVRLRIFAALLLAAVVAAGCGSSASSSQTAQAQFVSRASAICTRAAQRGRKLDEPVGLAESIDFL